MTAGILRGFHLISGITSIFEGDQMDRAPRSSWCKYHGPLDRFVVYGVLSLKSAYLSSLF
jgi:hypothetical protein